MKFATKKQGFRYCQPIWNISQQHQFKDYSVFIRGFKIMYYLTVFLSYWFLKKCVQIVLNTCLGFPSCQTYSINNHGEKNCGKFNAQYSSLELFNNYPTSARWI